MEQLIDKYLKLSSNINILNNTIVCNNHNFDFIKNILKFFLFIMWIIFTYNIILRHFKLFIWSKIKHTTYIGNKLNNMIYFNTTIYIKKSELDCHIFVCSVFLQNNDRSLFKIRIFTEVKTEGTNLLTRYFIELYFVMSYIETMWYESNWY